MRDLNRNHYFAMGLIILAMGLQLRYVDSFTLTEESSRFIAKKMGMNPIAAPPPTLSLIRFPGLDLSTPPPMKRRIRPPRWLGFSLISLGSVLVVHSLAMKKSGS